MPDFERPFPIRKEVLDTVNSISWFLLDAFWMLDMRSAAYVFLPPTILTGLFLLYTDKRRPILFINLAINCWIWMNTLWMLSDMEANSTYLAYARSLFVLGVFFILIAAFTSKSLMDTFSHFKRFRVLKIR